MTLVLYALYNDMEGHCTFDNIIGIGVLQDTFVKIVTWHCSLNNMRGISFVHNVKGCRMAIL